MQNGNILVIEDDPGIRNMLSLALEMSDYSVSTATNGQEGLDLLSKAARPCLILLDLMMPVMDGWSFARKVEEDSKLNEIPFVVLTAFADRAASIKNSCAILKKPVDLDKLMSLVGKYCGGNDGRRLT